MTLVFRSILLLSLFSSPSVWADDPLPAPIDVQLDAPVQLSPGTRLQKLIVRVKGVFHKGGAERLAAIKALPSEDEKKKELLKAMSGIMKVPEMEIEAMIYTITNNHDLRKEREGILEENSKRVTSNRLFQDVYGYNPQNGYDPALPLGLDKVRLDGRKLEAYLAPEDDTVRLALIRFTVNGIATTYSLYRGGNKGLSFVLGPVVGMLSAGFTIYQNQFFDFITDKKYFETRLLKKMEANGVEASEKRMALAQWMDRWIGGPNRKWVETEAALNFLIYVPMAIWGTLADKYLAFVATDLAVTTGLDAVEQGVYEIGISKQSQREIQQRDLEFILTGDEEKWRGQRSSLERKQKLMGLFGSLVGTALKIDKMAAANYIFPKVVAFTIGAGADAIPIEATYGILAAAGGAVAYTIYQTIQANSFDKNYEFFSKLIGRSVKEKKEEVTDAKAGVCTRVVQGLKAIRDW